MLSGKDRLVFLTRDRQEVLGINVACFCKRMKLASADGRMALELMSAKGRVPDVLEEAKAGVGRHGDQVESWGR
jgi:hypothetical protein